MRALELNHGDYFEDRMNPGILRVVDGDPIGLGTKVIAVTQDGRVVPIHSDSLVFLVDQPLGGKLGFTITHHEDNREISGRIEALHGNIEIFFDGYGVHDMEPGHGSPLFVEVGDDGHPVLRAWTEIDGQDPSHTISFAGARDRRPLTYTRTSETAPETLAEQVADANRAADQL
jgi:hypothetical protein